MNIIRVISFVLIYWSFNTFCNAQINEIENAQSKINLIEEEIKAVMLRENIPAISLGLIINGKEKHFLNYGHLSRNKKEKIDENSIYQIASLSKMLIGIVAQNLILEGKIDVNQPITDFIPFKFNKKTSKKLAAISILKLLHHESGVPRNAKAGYKRKDGTAYLYNYKLTDLEKELRKMKIKKAGRHKYSNFGYALLAYIFEQASNQTYKELLSKYISEPYALKSTQLILPKAKTQSVVTPYNKNSRLKEMQLWTMGMLGPPSAVYSSTQDLCKIMVQQIAAYRLIDERSNHPLILTNNTKLMDESSGIQYGYGMVKWNSNSFGHGGDMDGFESDFSIVPNKNYGMVLLTSSGGNWVPRLIYKIHKILRE